MKNVIKKLTFLILSVSLFLNFSAIAVDVTQVVKVGYIANFGVLKDPQTDGLYGYGYEYLEKISEYSNVNYMFEYVECTKQNYMQMLESGQIDIFAPISSYDISSSASNNLSDDTSSSPYVYSSKSFAENSVFITDLSLSPDNFTDLSYLNDKKIGVPNDDYILEKVESFLYSNGLNSQVILADIRDFATEKQNQTYDLLVTNSLQMNHGVNVISTIDRYSVYFIAMQENKDLIEDFDYAMNQIQNFEYNFLYNLSTKYFDYNLSYRDSISDDELSFLTSAPIKIGVTATETPLSYVNLDEEIAGASVDILKSLFDNFQINATFEILPENPSESELSSYDLLAMSVDQTNKSTKNHSNPYAYLPYVLVSELNSSSQTIGSLQNYGVSEDIILYYAPNQNVIFYNSVDDLIDAFESGKINSMFVTESTLDMLLSEVSPTNHTMKNIEYLLAPLVTFNDKYTDENIETFNKMLAYIGEDIQKYAVLRHSFLINAEESSFWDNFNLAYIFIPLSFLILCLLFYVVYRKAVFKRSEIIKNISRTDPLTGLLNEQEFINQVRLCLKSNNTAGIYSLISIDIDNFKLLNDKNGYKAGSQILKTVGEFLNQSRESGMPLCRRSADNFIMLCDTYGLAMNLRDFIVNDGLPTQISKKLQDGHIVTFSIGKYAINDTSVDIGHMIDCANIARMQGKRVVGTSEHKYSDEIKQKTSVQNDILTKMHKAIDNNEFILYYQLKVDLNKLLLAGAEALVRWVSDGEVIPPNDFIPVFEENGFIEILDYHVLEMACKFIQEHRARRGKQFPVISVNVSGLTMMKPDLIKNIVAITKKYNVKPTELDLEITESAFVDHTEFSKNKVDKLRELGFTISMDDFGTGISTLNRLKDIHFDTLKIDRQFIVDSLDNDRSTIIIKNVVQMASELELATVAEGIETPEQLLFLRDMGCEYGQGFYFSKPLPPVEFLEVLDTYKYKKDTK